MAGIAPGATVRLRCFISQTNVNARSTVDRISIVVPSGTDTPPGENNPIEGPPIGGADDLFGACGGTAEWMPLGLAGLEPGLWTISYLGLDSQGCLSNIRWEYLELGGETPAGSASIRPKAGPDLTLALGAYQFSTDDVNLHPVQGGTCEVRRNGVLEDTFRIENSLLEVSLPLGQTSNPRFNWPGANEVVRLRLEFRDDYLKVFDENRGDKEVEVFQILGADAYALEYYRNRIYICNQSQEEGPILGRLYGPWPD